MTKNCRDDSQWLHHVQSMLINSRELRDEYVLYGVQSSEVPGIIIIT